MAVKVPPGGWMELTAPVHAVALDPSGNGKDTCS
jgi:hypothetical protein